MSAFVLGAGVTGLAAAIASGAPVLEAASGPGGICRTYYLDAAGERSDHAPPADDAYRFEVGGGHWIFGGDAATLDWMEGLAPMRPYERRAAVLVQPAGPLVPYPLQANVPALGAGVVERVAAEPPAEPAPVPPSEETLSAWLERRFGTTLCALFFGPFHDRYTAGLTGQVSPQDEYKSPPSGADARQRVVGYNGRFSYPAGGLDALVGAMAERADVRYGTKVAAVDPKARRIRLEDGRSLPYDRLVSTVPLHRALELAGVAVSEPPDPFTSVLVLNIGGERGPECPDEHWVYEAASAAGFHRIGFYSNVDTSFLPRAHRGDHSHVSMYVERAFLPGRRPEGAELRAYTDAVLEEMGGRHYVGAIDVVDASFVEVAYTWRRPHSQWREKALAALEAAGVHQVGRYGQWHFQGIAESIRDGLGIGERLRRARPGSPL